MRLVQGRAVLPMIACTSETCTMGGRGQTSRPTNKNAPHCCEAFGAENETRTRDPDLGKVVLYQLSYFRSISKTRSCGTGLQRYGKILNLQIFFQFFRFLDFARTARRDIALIARRNFARNEKRPSPEEAGRLFT